MATNNPLMQSSPQPYPQPFYANWYPMNRAFWGIPATAVLLCLGVPF